VNPPCRSTTESKQYTENIITVARHQNSEYSTVFVIFLEWVHLAGVPTGIVKKFG
jgi:hypothetical protein